MANSIHEIGMLLWTVFFTNIDLWLCSKYIVQLFDFQTKMKNPLTHTNQGKFTV